MHKPITLPRLRALNPGSSRLLTTGVVGLLGVGLHLPGRRVRFDVQGWEQLPAGPCVMVANHTHWIDWIALRWIAYWRGRTLCNWVKPRTYEEGYAQFLDKTGNLPVVSRGYLLSADVRAVAGRAPTEAEYRALRNHLDHGTALPDTPLMRRLQSESRDVLGLRFCAADRSYRDFLEELFYQMMQATLAHTRTLCDLGNDLQIMPQGVTSQRLTLGRPGALQAALALDLPVVPIGVNGFPQAFGKGATFPQHGGTVTIRVGAPYRPTPLPEHRPFQPASERAHQRELQAGTAAMMDRIAALLDPEHGPADSEAEADVQGVARFV